MFTMFQDCICEVHKACLVPGLCKHHLASLIPGQAFLVELKDLIRRYSTTTSSYTLYTHFEFHTCIVNFTCNKHSVLDSNHIGRH